LRTAFGCLCQAVIYLHGAQIKHKDIKPSNILVHNDTVILTDFGIAHDYSDLDEGSNTGGPTGFTAAYAAPEVVRQERRNRSADIFSLGCVFLEMITVVLGETLEGL
ncbi:kinase-like protein, partial [Glonium stellatum]